MVITRGRTLSALGGTLIAGGGVARAQARPAIRFGTLTGESFAEALYANDAGFFDRAGLDAQLTFLASGGAVTAAVIGGAIDVGVTNVGSMAAAHERGLPLYLIAPCTVTVPGPRAATVIAVRADSPIRTARDFTGKTVSVSTLRDLQQAATMNWIDRNGGDAKSVSFVEIPNPSQPAALASGRVDGIVLVEPWVTMEEAAIRVIGRPYESIAPRILVSGWIANHGWYEANAGVARSFVAAMRATAVWANAHHDETAAILAKYSKIPREVVAKMNRLEVGEQLDPKLIQPAIDVTVRYGFLPKSFAAGELFAG